jgi:cysteine-rich repeat protein
VRHHTAPRELAGGWPRHASCFSPGVRIPGALVTAAWLAASAARASAPAFPGAITATIAGAGADLPIPDAGDGTALIVGATSTLAGTVLDVDVTVNIAHPAVGQLQLYLVSPSFTVVTLIAKLGGNRSGVLAGTTFDDQAPPLTAPPPAASAASVRNYPYAATGTPFPMAHVQPHEALAKLVGEPAAGPWTLVVLDSTAGQRGTLVSWSLTITALSAPASPSPPTTFTGPGTKIPDNTATGASSTIAVRGLGSRLWDANVTVAIRHPNPSELELYLTAPSGKRVDLVTRLSGQGMARANLFAGTTFDDQAGMPVSLVNPLPPSGTALATVTPDGALAQFMGDDPNGTWTLTVADRVGGNTGTLDGWSLTLVTAGTCGDGVVDPGEQCDDGAANGTAGARCTAACTLAPTSGGETSCTDCVDNDGNGLVDAADPACGATRFTLDRVHLRAAHGRVRFTLAGRLPAAPAAGAEVALVLGAGPGHGGCTVLGTLAGRGRRLGASGSLAGGSVRLRIAGARMSVRGRGLGLGVLVARPTVTLGLRLGRALYVATAPAGRAQPTPRAPRPVLRRLPWAPDRTGFARFGGR